MKFLTRLKIVYEKFILMIESKKTKQKRIAKKIQIRKVRRQKSKVFEA